MVRVHADKAASVCGRVASVLRKVARQTKMAFSGSLLRPTLLMIVINFSIQFG